jgi:intracellular multiplication protein IcmO
MAKRTREFEGVEHTDVIRLASRRERRKSLSEWVKDCHNDPADVLKPYLGLAVIAVLLSWAPFWPELLAIGSVFLALSQGSYARKLWDAPFRVPITLGRRGFKDKSTGAPGNGIIYHGVGRGAYAGQEVWSSAKDIQTHRMVIGMTGSGKSEEIFGLIFNALCLNSGSIMVDGKASADTLNSYKKIVRLFGRDEDFLCLCFMMGAKDFYGHSEVKLTNTFNPFSMGSSDQKSTLMETFIPPAEGSNSVFSQRAMQLNKALPRPLTFLQERGYVDYNPRLLTEFFQLNNVENLVWFGRFRDKHGRVVSLPEEGKHKDWLLLKQACASLEQVLMDLPGYSQVMPKEPPPMIDSNDTRIANALLSGENEVETLSREMVENYRKMASSGGGGGDQNQAAETSRAEVYRQWGYMTMSLSEPAAMLTYSFGHVFNAEVGEINMSDVFLNRRLVFVMIPSLEKAPPSTAALGKITVAAVKQVLGNLLHKPLEGDRRSIVDASPSNSLMPYPLIFDEYGYYVVEGFSVAAAQARSFGVSCTFGMQTPDSLEKASPQEASETIQNTTLRHVGRFVGGEESQTFKTIRGWGSKVMTPVSRGMKVDHRAAFKTTRLSDEVSYEEEDVIKYADVAGQENGQFHMIVGTQTREGNIRRAESRTIRYTAFYTGGVPEVTEWRLNHFVAVKSRDAGSIEAIRKRDRQERMLEALSGETIKDWSLSQADPTRTYLDHKDRDGIAVLLRDVLTTLSSVVRDERFRRSKPTPQTPIEVISATLKDMLESGLVSQGQIDAAIMESLAALDSSSGAISVNREIDQLEDVLKKRYAESISGAGLTVVENDLALAAFGVLIDHPIRVARRTALRNNSIKTATLNTGALLAAAE